MLVTSSRDGPEMPDDDDQGFGTVSGYGHDAEPDQEVAARPGNVQDRSGSLPDPPPSYRNAWFDWFRRLLRR